MRKLRTCWLQQRTEKRKSNERNKHEKQLTNIRDFGPWRICRCHNLAESYSATRKSAWLKLHFTAEFMSAVLTNGKGFYHPLVYVLECHRLGLGLLPPSVNAPGPTFVPQGSLIQVPLTNVKRLRDRTTEAILAERGREPFVSLGDFFRRVAPAPEEMEAMIRVGAFDKFGETRTRQFWQKQHLHNQFGSQVEPNQGWLVPPPGLEQLPGVPLQEPTHRERLQAETELFGFTVSGHPLELFDDVAWETYCPVNRLGEFVG
jgi:DNA polymerase III alpha subunit